MALLISGYIDVLAKLWRSFAFLLLLLGVQAINGTANDIEKLASQLTSAAVRVRHTPTDVGCTEHLGQLRRDWTARIHLLTSLVDDITDFNDFVLMTGII